jgi:hypothetical protein
MICLEHFSGRSICSQLQLRNAQKLKRQLPLSNFEQNYNVWAHIKFNQNPCREFLHANERTERHDEANERISATSRLQHAKNSIFQITCLSSFYNDFNSVFRHQICRPIYYTLINL